MAPFRRRRNYDDWRRNHSFGRRLNLRSFHHPSGDLNDYNSYLRPLLPRNHRNYVISQSNSNEQPHQNNPEPARRFRNIVWNALSHSASNLRTELINVVTTHIVEFGVAVISAYISNFVFG